MQTTQKISWETDPKPAKTKEVVTAIPFPQALSAVIYLHSTLYHGLRFRFYGLTWCDDCLIKRKEMIKSAYGPEKRTNNL